VSRSDGGPRVAVVTGSDSGIGNATAVRLAADGFDVGITWHTDEAGAKSAAEEVRAHGQRAEVRQVDLSDLPAAADVVDDLADALGGLDAFVNNAGTGASSPFVDTSWDDWRHTLAVDLDAPFLCAQRAARRMIEDGNGGRIVNVTSVHEHVPLKGSSAYCASKGGLGLLTKVMALELAEHGITVNSVAPGEISTPMTGQHDVDPRQQRRPGIPMGRPGDAAEVASLVAWIVGPESSYVTGASYVVDGGLLLMAAVANSS
jgi:NAD(P)-dependent dehydrogenase (short-subunit alcohol dehydrogenase family)